MLDHQLRRFYKAHGTRYDYQWVTYYKGNLTRIMVVCPDHGPWETTFANHGAGHGCPRCAKYGFDYDKPAVFYYARVNCTPGPLYLVGISNHSFRKRYRKNDRALMDLLFQWEFDVGMDCYNFEQQIIEDNKEHLFQGVCPLDRKGRGPNAKSKELFTKDILNGEPRGILPG
jgi:hypothetical protein